MGRILGIEGTAWAASAALYDPVEGPVEMETMPYRPATGGIDPAAAAEHMAEALPAVLERILERGATDVEAVAFSRGPGLGPCLRVTGATARAAAARLDVPLVGVNHMVAHAEVGRLLGDVEDPIVLNASGANAHVLGFRNGRYRVLGETMDTGVGNALDKFARHLGWSHPGGPKVERHAREGVYVELPYVVKGMDFSFAGLTSAAKATVDEGTPVEDVCCGLQETIFAMLTEVTERALALTHRDEVVLGGGVAQNERLQAMIRAMADERGATVAIPPSRFLRDNAAMIAMTGAEMLASGQTVELADSRVRPEYRPEQVAVRWRASRSPARPTDDGPQRGAEAVVETTSAGRVRKRRVPRAYRHPALDARLRRRRTVREARLLHAARRAGVPTPTVYDVDPDAATLELAHVGHADLRDALTRERVERVGRHLATLHEAAGLVHGDPTVRNVRVGDSRLYLIDFGLGFRSDHVEDRAMDLHVFLQSLQDVATDREPYRAALLAGYTAVGPTDARDQLREIEGRGRYR
ncbi:MAG: bifunctional N(6)-L-threonylcarbamoyladenine synthase/serine/threonine protein kinase [Halobacteriales archaeon]